jgi:DNA polymerase
VREPLIQDPLPFSLGWLGCRRCELHKTRTNVVLGVGNPHADLFFLGPYPGPDEDKVGLPFVGDAGKAFEKELHHTKVELSRDDIFIDNVAACWPTREEGGKIVTGKPALDQIKACRWRIWEAIYRVDPLLIVALGDVALKALTGDATNIGSARGEIYMSRVPGFYKHLTYPVFATFNPAFISRNPQDRAGTPRRLFREDLIEAKTLVSKLRESYEDEED